MADANDITKQCRGCGEIKPLNAFGTRYDKRAGKRYPNGRCLVCHAKDSADWRKNNPEKSREAIAASYERHKEAKRRKAREHYQKNRDKIAGRRAKRRAANRPPKVDLTPEEMDARKAATRAYQAAYRAANRSAFRAYQARWREVNVESARAAVERWRRDNPEKHRAKELRRRAHKRNAGGKVTGDQILGLVEKQRSKCWYCSKSLEKGYHVDHRIPLSRGGGGGIDNLVAACPPCNLSKGAKTPQEFVGRLF